MENQLENIIQQVWHKEKRNLFTFLTGAGISSDSGIPTYRGTSDAYFTIWLISSANYSYRNTSHASRPLHQIALTPYR